MVWTLFLLLGIIHPHQNMVIHLHHLHIQLVDIHLLMVMSLLLTLQPQECKPVRVTVAKVVLVVPVASVMTCVCPQETVVKTRMSTAQLSWSTLDLLLLKQQQHLHHAWAIYPHHARLLICMQLFLLHGTMLHRLISHTVIQRHRSLIQEAEIQAQIILWVLHHRIHHLLENHAKVGVVRVV
jgi:hypothetical protein